MQGKIILLLFSASLLVFGEKLREFDGVLVGELDS